MLPPPPQPKELLFQILKKQQKKPQKRNTLSKGYQSLSTDIKLLKYSSALKSKRHRKPSISRTAEDNCSLDKAYVRIIEHR